MSGWSSRGVALGLVASLLLARVAAQQMVGEWRVYTDMKEVRSIALQEGALWNATGGGIFRLDLASNGITTFTTADGLASNDLTAVAADSEGRVVVGSEDGSLGVWDAATGQWSIIQDIQISDRVQKGIRLLRFEGDTLFVGTDFGISIFLLERWEFGDTYANFGFPMTTKVNDLRVFLDTLWVATNQGVARAPRFGANLSSPTLWTRYSTTEGLPSPSVHAVEIFHDTVVVGTSVGAAFFGGSAFQVLMQAGSGAVGDLRSDGGRLVLLIRGGGTDVLEMSALDGPATVVAANAGVIGSQLEAGSDSAMFWLGTSSAGAARWNGSSWMYYGPNAPASNLFISVAVAEDGVVWGASGANAGGKGFYRFNPALPEGERWKNFNRSSLPLLPTDDYYKVSVGTEGRRWVSAWGYGVAEVTGDTVRRLIDASTTPRLAGSVAHDPDFAVIGGVAADDGGDTWFANRTAVDGNILARLIDDTTFLRYKNMVNPIEGRVAAMVIDGNGTKWFGNGEPFAKAATGLYYFNEEMTVPGTESSGGWGYVGMSDGLPNNSVLSLAVDVDGQVCIGTDLGLMIVTDPLYPRQRKITSFPLREQVIQALAVDAVNNKWVGTKEGLFLVNPDGTQLLEHHTVSSTGGRLLDNDVRALAIDGNRGILYVGTEKGLSSLGIAPVQTARAVTTLMIAPNPYLIPGDRPVEIRTLAPDSWVKILSVTGSLVTEFRAQGGGRAFWSGTEKNGKLVGSGVYFVVAYAENGEQVGTGKVTVIRR